MPTLDVTLVQQASTLDLAGNRDLMRTSMESLAATAATESGSPGLVVFPEAFMCDFGSPGTDISEYAEDTDGVFVETMTELAKEHDTTIVAGMFERSADPGRPYNTLAVVDGDGLRATYRKIHLYDSFGYKESERLLAGAVEPVVVEVGGVRVGLMTCYDLRFPELARLLTEQGAELLVVPAAWVAGPGKVDHWTTLARARAIENTVYVAAAGQPAPRYTGHSMVVTPLGDVVVEAGGSDEVVGAAVESSVVEQARAVNPSLANRRF